VYPNTLVVRIDADQLDLLEQREVLRSVRNSMLTPAYVRLPEPRHARDQLLVHGAHTVVAQALDVRWLELQIDDLLHRCDREAGPRGHAADGCPHRTRSPA